MISERTQNDLPGFLYQQGTNYNAHAYFGCHFDHAQGNAVFRVWAPNAREISVVGDWNGWTAGANPMKRISEAGAWEAVVGGVALWQRYKYAVAGQDDVERLKADPFAFHAETDGNTASIIYDIEDYRWEDDLWIRRRRHQQMQDKPVNIYEMHAGSWRRRQNGGFLSFAELADQAVPYLSDMGYTHVELLPVMEHSSVRSWGYQTSGYFAPSSRFGAPRDLMVFIDRCHQAGIGVILDWVPSGIPREVQGLAKFDGTFLYEEPGAQGKEQRDWSSGSFNYGRPEVHSFLISNAVFWLETYHADGLRVCGVNSMLWLDYGKKEGERTPNSDGGNENLDATDFLQKLNIVVHENSPGAMMIAEESTSWPQVTKPVREGGLGFQFKWNTRWTNDMLDYICVDPIYRKMIHDKITFSLYYAFDENFILPVSHNDVVYGKRSLLDRMHGEYDWKFAGVRAFFGYQMSYPGKKLHFMGCEIGQFKEWDHNASVEWFLLEYPAHRRLLEYVRALNKLYLETPALWESDHSWDGFQWIVADDSERNIVAFLRTDKKNNAVVVLQNFAPVIREGYRIGVPEAGVYEEIFNSDKEIYGGWGNVNKPRLTEEAQLFGFPYSLQVTAPPMATVFFRLRSPLPEPEPATEPLISERLRFKEAEPPEPE